MPQLTSNKSTADELISEEIKEIISYRPHWIIRNCGTVFLVVVVGALLLTWFIEYPDMVNASARIVAMNAPKAAVAKADGKLDRLLVSDEQKVVQGQHLAYIHSNEDHDQVLQLQKWLGQALSLVKDGALTTLLTSSPPELTQLGDLQSTYQEFQDVWLETRQILSSGYYQKKKQAIQKDLQYLAELKGRAIEQRKIMEQDQALKNQEYEAYESLAKDKVIAPLELNQYKSRLLDKRQQLEQIGAQVTNSELSSHNKRKELLDLQKYIMEQEQAFYNTLLNLKSEVEKWVQLYVVSAPEDGRVFFVGSLQENQLVANRQELFYIQSQYSKFYGDLRAGQNGLGKVKPGQNVIIRPESYPEQEFGYIKGRVTRITHLPNKNDSFLIYVDLPNGLKTSYNKELFFRNHLAANADIITDDKRLIDRLLGQLRQLGKR